MQRLFEGVHRFQTEKFGKYKSLFRKLSKNGQNPHTLFITCCDSRVLAELITQSQPGDLFVVKNIGNIVPPSDVTASPNSTAAAIEFAVQSLEVNDIVVCGHSQCGAITALIEGIKNPSAMPHLTEWLSLAAPVQKVIAANYSHLSHGEELLDAAAEENVLFSLENLHTYPSVQDRLEKGTLHIHGWFFKIATGELFAYDPAQKQFLPLQKPETAA